MGLLLALVMAAAPQPSANARLYFLAGDLSKAVEWAKRCVATEPEVCRPMLKALAEYAFLANHTDELTLEQARDFIAYDRVVSATVPGKLTKPVIARFVTGPLARAHELMASDAAQAKSLVERVLTVDPANAEALKLRKALG